LAHEVAGGRLLVTGGGGYSAASVSRVLGFVPWLLSGSPTAPKSDDALPETWRSTFVERTGRPAPRHWVDDAPTPGDGGEAANRIVERLGERLGRRFPAAPGR
jgi:acetoin utilization protein AcuC